MFKLKRPCVDCPFKRGTKVILRQDRLLEIAGAAAFQCHKTVDYEQFDDPELRQGEHPQQCAGLMAVLCRDNALNAIMQVAQRLNHLDLSELDPDEEAFGSLVEAVNYHRTVTFKENIP